MAGSAKNQTRGEYLKAMDLVMKFEFVTDETRDSEHRTSQVRKMIAQMVLLARKRGRPSQKEETSEAAA